MEGKERVLSCMIRGPGPVYKLPPLVGYNGHDPSRHRNPAYSMRIRTDGKSYILGPGPQYNIRSLTKFGPEKSPAYTIRSREKWKLQDLAPGPGAYSPELCPPMNHNRRAPAYSMRSRGKTKIADEGPGPSSYLLPTCIGPKVPDKPAKGAFSMYRHEWLFKCMRTHQFALIFMSYICDNFFSAGYHVIREEMTSPGPAAYAEVDYSVVKRRNPVYSLKGRHFLSEPYRSPAPTFYPLYDTRKRAPMYSFGVKHSECTGIPMTQLDEDL